MLFTKTLEIVDDSIKQLESVTEDNGIHINSKLYNGLEKV